jgi:hypothetical protein
MTLDQSSRYKSFKITESWAVGAHLKTWQLDPDLIRTNHLLVNDDVKTSALQREFSTIPKNQSERLQPGLLISIVIRIAAGLATRSSEVGSTIRCLVINLHQYCGAEFV